MTWKGIKPLVSLVEGTDEKGVKVLTKELEQLGSSVCVMQWTGVIRDGTLIEKGI
jgi:hypothetical protein